MLRRRRQPLSRLPLTDFETIYLGSELVSLAEVPGEVDAYEHASWAHDFSESALEITRARLHRLKAHGCDAADVIVPAVPARELHRKGKPMQPKGWPMPMVRGPYMKVSRLEQSAATAVASGARSALMRADDGKWYRLKGCGNHDKGVVVRENAGGWRDLRGVAFVHTAARELYWTTRLATAIERTPSANIALGRFLYSAPNAPFGDKEPNLRPACVVHQTLGDRRLGTHVLAGLHLLLPCLLDAACLSSGADELRGAFPAMRPDPRGVSTAQLSPRITCLPVSSSGQASEPTPPGCSGTSCRATRAALAASARAARLSRFERRRRHPRRANGPSLARNACHQIGNDAGAMPATSLAASWRPLLTVLRVLCRTCLPPSGTNAVGSCALCTPKASPGARTRTRCATTASGIAMRIRTISCCFRRGRR